MRVEVLGDVRVDGEVDVLPHRDRVALTVLAMHRDGSVSVDRIADALWGDEAPPSHAKVVHGCISRLRKRLGHEAIATLPDGYRLGLPDDEVDVRRFERLVAEGRTLSALGEHDRAVHTLDVALSLWSGSPLTSVDDWDEGRTERQRLLSLHEDAEELRTDAMLRAGRPREALHAAVGLVEDRPLREARWGLLARAQYQCGRQVEALATLDRARAVLCDELGLDASPALERLREQILRHDERLAIPDAAVTVAATCPYPGLVPFGPDDEDDFFGREREVAECLARLERDGVVVVAGPSGSGKSSLVRAGLAARCRANGRSVGEVVTTDRLAADLTAVGDRPDVLVVDQLERLTAPGMAEQRRVAAIDAIVDHAFRGDLVLVVRSDRLGDLAATQLAGLVEDGLLLLGPMDAESLRRAIEGPAERNGLLVEPGLVDLLVHEVEDEPGALPLLAHALRRCWERREGRTLTVAGYHGAGGVRGAIAQTAESVHGLLDDTGRARLRELLLRMVARSEDGGIVAAPVAADSVDDHVAREVVGRLVAARLVTVDGDRIVLAHEALTRAWPRLQLWLDEDVAGQRILRHLTVSAHEWDALGRPHSELYRGVRLEDVLAWCEQARPHLTPVETTFLDDAVERRRHERDEERARAAGAARTNRRLRRRLRAIAVVSLLAVVAGVLAASSAVRAGRDSLAADARRVGSQALLAERPDTSLLLAAGAVALDDSSDTRASLLTALGRSPALSRVLVPADGGALTDVAISADGSVVSVDEEGVGTRFVDPATGAVVAVIPDGDGPLGAVDLGAGGTAFHPDGGPVAHGSGSFEAATHFYRGEQETLRLWLLDPVTLARRETLTIDRGLAEWLLPMDLAWSPDGGSLAVVLHSYRAGTPFRPSGAVLAVWRLGETRPALVTDTVPTATRSLAWSPDGTTIVTATDPGLLGADPVPTTTTWDSTTLTPLATIDGVAHPIAISPDGGTLAGAVATIDGSGPVVLLDVATGEETIRLDGTDSPVRALTFSPDGDRIAVAGGRAARLWDPTAGRLVEELVGHADEVADLEFARDGRTLVTVGVDGAALTWDVTGTQRLLERRARADRPVELRPLALLPAVASIGRDGRTVVHVGAMLHPSFGTVWAGIQVLDVASGRLSEPRLVGQTPWRTVLWRSDGTPMTIDTGGDLATWDPRSGERVRREGLRVFGSLTGIVGDRVVVLNTKSSVVIWADGPRSRPLGGLMVLEDDEDGPRLSPFSIRPLATSEVGPTVAAFAGSLTTERGDVEGVNVWDLFNFSTLPTSEHLVVFELDDLDGARVFPLGFDGAAAAFDPTAERIAVTGRLGTVVVLDAATGGPVGPPVVGHEGAASSVVWVADGRIVATGGQDGRVALWDGGTGESLGSLRVARPGSAAFVGSGADAHEVMVATTDGEVFSLDTRVEEWIRTACAVAGRSLSDAEWAAVAGGRTAPGACGAR